MKRRESAEEAAPEFCVVFAEIALQPVNREARKEVESITRLVAKDSFEVSELHRHMNAVDDYKLTLDDSTIEELAGEVLAKKTVKSKSDSSASGGTLYEKIVVPFSRRQLAARLPQEVLYSSLGALEKVEPPAATLHGLKT